MKFLLINDNEELTGGSAVVFESQARLLKELGHKVFTFCFSTAFWQDEHNLRFPNHKKWWSRKLFKFTFHPKVYLVLRSFICKIQPDVIVIHNNALYPASILLACRGYPVVNEVHDFYLVCPTIWAVQKRTLMTCPGGIGLKCTKEGCVNLPALLFFHWPLFFMRRIILKKVLCAYIAPSQVLVEYLRRFGYPAILLRNPVPYFKRINLLLKHESSAVYTAENADNAYILYVGLLSDNKGVDYLIKAFAKVHAVCPWLRLKVAGQGISRKALEHLACELKVAKAVDFLGIVPRDKLPMLYKKAIALIVPSIGQENFPTVISEAMNFGCPVIGSARGGIPELLGDNERGLLFRPGDVDDLSDKILLLLRDVALREKLSRQAKLYVRTMLSPQNYIKKFIEIIHDILTANRLDRRHA